METKEIKTIQIPQTMEELEFSESVEKVIPILEKLRDLLSNGRVTLKGQKYRMQNNDLIVQRQEKQISEHAALIESSKNQASAIITAAENRVLEIDKTIQMRIAQANHMEREAKRVLEDAEKKSWESKQKKV